MALALGLACAVMPGTAHAQAEGGPVLGLPIVVKENGWARYATTTEDGEPAELVFKVGSPGSHKNQQGRWILLEVEIPQVGRVGMDFLVVGGNFTPQNFALVRTRMPGQPTREGVPNKLRGELPKPTVVRKGTEQVAGQTVPVTEYAFSRGTTATWSPSVPGVGFTRVTGSQSMRLVAFGVGGDPWKSAQNKPIWPTEKKKPAPQP